MQSVSIVGIGRLGGALAIALSRAGFALDNLVHRDPATARSISTQLTSKTELLSWATFPSRLRSNVILIATPDPEIRSVAHALENRIAEGSIVLHTSGSLSSEVLSPLAALGHPTGSLHPLISVSHAASGSDHFANAFFCVEGDDAAVETARSIVEALGGSSFSIDPAKKALYHASAVVACGHLVALLDTAIEMLSKCGVEREDAQRILLPLVYTTIDNLRTSSPERALTGSFARTDIEAIRRHLDSIDAAALRSTSRDIYLLLGERSLDLAAANGADASEVQELHEVISIAKRKLGC